MPRCGVTSTHQWVVSEAIETQLTLIILLVIVYFGLCNRILKVEFQIYFIALSEQREVWESNLLWRIADHPFQKAGESRVRSSALKEKKSLSLNSIAIGCQNFAVQDIDRPITFGLLLNDSRLFVTLCIIVAESLIWCRCLQRFASLSCLGCKPYFKLFSFCQVLSFPEGWWPTTNLTLYWSSDLSSHFSNDCNCLFQLG